MRRVSRLILGAAFLTAFAASVVAQPKTFVPRDESPEEFAAAPGREETFYTCTACHNFKLVAQQGMNRRQWEEILVVMNEKHGMPVLEGKERETVLNYLATAYPQTTPAAGGGWQNPFLNR